LKPMVGCVSGIGCAPGLGDAERFERPKVCCSREFPGVRLLRLSGAEVLRRNSDRIGGFEKGEFERNGARKKVAAQICVRRADTVQLRAQEVTNPRKFGLSCSVIHSACTKVVRQRLRRAGGPIEIQPFGHHEN